MESSLLIARTKSRKGGLGAIQLALRSGAIPETACKVILPLVLLWGLPQTCHSTLSPFCGFWQKRKKEMKKLTKNCDGFWLVSSFQHNFLLWHWELGFSKASNFSAYVSLSQINLWKRGCGGLCKTCWHSCISLLWKWFGFFNLKRAETIHWAPVLHHRWKWGHSVTWPFRLLPTLVLSKKSLVLKLFLMYGHGSWSYIFDLQSGKGWQEKGQTRPS